MRSVAGVSIGVMVLILASAGIAPSATASSVTASNCSPNSPSCVDVTPADAAFVGTGGLLIPPDSFTGSSIDRSSAAACPDCEWALVPVCKQAQGNVGCGPAATSCPAGSRRMVVLLSRPPFTSWDNVGSYCVSGSPLTVDDVAQQLSDVVINRVPPLQPSFQPAGATLVNLPTLFASGQPRRLGTRRFELVGFAIVLNAQASWRWTFGDGSILDTESPGGAWPNQSVSHTYAAPGGRVVRVVSQWQGWFTVDGLGPFSVAGPTVTQVSGPLPIQVHEARAVLVGE